MRLFTTSACTGCFFSAVLIAFAGNAQEVQSPPISTERPTVGSSPDLIPRGSLQVENGVGFSFQRTRYVADLPETLIRVGLHDRAEVRFLFSDEVYQKPHAPHISIFQSQDPALSIKVGLGKANQAIPRSAILSLSFPTGGQSWTSGSYDPTITGIWTQTIGKNYFLNELAGAGLTTLAGTRRAWWTPSLAGGRSLTATVTAFAEYAPTVLPNGDRTYVVDGGFSFIRKKFTQFDMRAGYQKDSSGYHTLLSVGYSLRRDGFLPRLASLGRSAASQVSAVSQ